MAEKSNVTSKELMEVLGDANAALEEIAVLLSSIEAAGVQVVDKIGTDAAQQSDEWIGTAIKSMADQGQRIADECTEKCRSIFRRAAGARQAGPAAGAEIAGQLEVH